MVEALIDAKTLYERLGDPNIRIVEVDYDPKTAYEIWHITGAILIPWTKLRHPTIRDFIEPADFERLLSDLGISNDHTVVLYGDYNNWFATYAFWLFEAYGHEKLLLLNGGRTKWAKEGYPTTTEIPSYPKAEYKVKRVDWGSRRVFLWEVLQVVTRGDVKKGIVALLDVRSPKEFTGEITAPPEYPTEAAQVGGHIPGAVNIPWSTAVNPDTGEFKNIEELRAIYSRQGITPDKEVITYCRIGERAAHTWFVLKHLLKHPAVRIYDGSWAEWGNLVRAPVEKEKKEIL